MRVLMITPSYLPIKGGAEIIIRDIVEKLNDENIHTDILTYNMNKKWSASWERKIIREKNYTIYKIPGLNWFPFLHSDRFTFGINMIPGLYWDIIEKYDILHFHGADDISLPFFSIHKRKLKIFQSHGFSKDFLKRYQINRYILKKIANKYIYLSKKMGVDFIDLGFDKKKLFYLPNSVDTDFYTSIDIKEKGKNTLLFVGRISQSKGLHILLDSIEMLNMPTILNIIGPIIDSDYFNYIKKRINIINNKNLHEINYLGVLDKVELKKWYQQSTLLILPTFYDAFPMVLLESLSCGTPVISTLTGGIPEIVINKKNGLLLKSNDKNALTKCIKYLLINEGIRKEYGENGRDMVVKHYSLKNNIKRLIQYYHEILSVHG